MPTALFDRSDRFVLDAAALDPIGATYLGVEGHDDQLTDYSPEGHAARAELARAMLADLDGVPDEGPDDRLARAFHQERLGSELELYEVGEWAADLNIIACPLQSFIDVLEVTADPDDLAARLAAVPEAVERWKRSLVEGVGRGLAACRYQAERTAEQAERRATVFVDAAREAADGGDEGRRDRLDRGGRAAAAAYGELAGWLRSWYAPRAREGHGVGPQRYGPLVRAFLGASIDPDEAYQWGWTEIARLTAEMEAVAARILPGASLPEVLDFVEHRSDYAVQGSEGLRRWAQEHVDTMIDRFGGSHFDLAAPLRTCVVSITPGGGATAPMYRPPTDDWRRPGMMLYPDLGDRRYPLWGQTTTANHEGVPGHHLQCAQAVLRADRLTRFQRGGFISGHGEGWALYAERLCDELGLLTRDEDRLGYLSAQQLRAVRVVIDIGIHLDLPVPAGIAGDDPVPWTPELARHLAGTLTGEAPDMIASEVDRYLGWPAQAISYKLGEREWLATRDEARRALGSSFDLKRFHTVALDLGPVGLELMRREVVGALVGADGAAPSPTTGG
jgi:uncharacterized protein (DUF885 family)